MPTQRRARRAHPDRSPVLTRICRHSRSTASRAGGRCASRSRLCCFPEPDLLLLDEPSNHLDLEATLWLENFLRAYPGQLVVISHERDLLNNVVDNILHLEGGKVTLYAGGYRRIRAPAPPNARRSSRRPRRRRTPSAPNSRIIVARNSARLDREAGAVARQAARQDAADRGARRGPDAGVRFSGAPTKLEPPLITARPRERRLLPDRPVLQRLNLRIDPDDRIALLGRNGNGKTTLARLLAAQLSPMAGAMAASGKMRVG